MSQQQLPKSLFLKEQLPPTPGGLTDKLNPRHRALGMSVQMSIYISLPMAIIMAVALYPNQVLVKFLQNVGIVMPIAFCVGFFSFNEFGRWPGLAKIAGRISGYDFIGRSRKGEPISSMIKNPRFWAFFLIADTWMCALIGGIRAFLTVALDGLQPGWFVRWLQIYAMAFAIAFVIAGIGIFIALWIMSKWMWNPAIFAHKMMKQPELTPTQKERSITV